VTICVSTSTVSKNVLTTKLLPLAVTVTLISLPLRPPQIAFAVTLVDSKPVACMPAFKRYSIC
ncbi:MAG: hypothetical protein WAX04_03140, partial [Oscillospiraceae bacterium]